MTESKKELFLDRNKNSLDFNNPAAHLFLLAPVHSMKSYRSYQLLIPTAVNASKNNGRNTSTSKNWVCQTYSSDLLMSSQM